ncbi:MAG: 30S ribosomal protein S16 [Bellilinea sp.]
MVRIRLRRVGLKGQPSYRIIAADKESPRDGRFLEILGSYNPRTEPFTFQVNEERIYHWLNNGAQPSESVAMLFKSVGLTSRYERVKGGEAAETVLKEAAEYYANRKVNTKTN